MKLLPFIIFLFMSNNCFCVEQNTDISQENGFFLSLFKKLNGGVEYAKGDFWKNSLKVAANYALPGSGHVFEFVDGVFNNDKMKKQKKATRDLLKELQTFSQNISEVASLAQQKKENFERLKKIWFEQLDTKETLLGLGDLALNHGEKEKVSLNPRDYLPDLPLESVEKWRKMMNLKKSINSGRQSFLNKKEYIDSFSDYIESVANVPSLEYQEYVLRAKIDLNAQKIKFLKEQQKVLDSKIQSFKKEVEQTDDANAIDALEGALRDYSVVSNQIRQTIEEDFKVNQEIKLLSEKKKYKEKIDKERRANFLFLRKSCFEK